MRVALLPGVEAPSTVSPAPSSPVVIVVQERTLVAVEVSESATLDGFVVAPSSTVEAPLLSVGVVATSALTVLPFSSLAPMVFCCGVVVHRRLDL